MRHRPMFIVLLTLGALAILIALTVGISSLQVTYRSVGIGEIADYVSARGTGYLQMVGSGALYVVNENDFTPHINGTHTFIAGGIISFVYEPGDTTNINVKSDSGTHLQGAAARVVEITAYVANGQTEFTTDAYIQHSRGYTWDICIGSIIAGLILIVVAFFLPRRRTAYATPVDDIDVPMQWTPYQSMPQYPDPLQQPTQYLQQPNWHLQQPYVQPQHYQPSPQHPQHEQPYPQQPRSSPQSPSSVGGLRRHRLAAYEQPYSSPQAPHSAPT